jgi:hypothetical protein
MKIYVFGNPEVPEYRKALDVARELGDTVAGVSFVRVEPNENVPFADEERVVILDTVVGVEEDRGSASGPTICLRLWSPRPPGTLRGGGRLARARLRAPMRVSAPSPMSTIAHLVSLSEWILD